MTTIPINAFVSNDAKKNLDIAAKFYVAGASATPAVVAVPSNTPPITAIPASAGVAAALLPHFSYASHVASNGTGWVSDFSLLLDWNEKLATALDNVTRAILPVAGVVNAPNFVTTGSAAPAVSGITSPTFEQLIYSLATAAGATAVISKVLIGTVTYIKVVGDYTFTPAGGGGGT